MTRRFVQIVDGFYADPERIRQKALQLSYAEPEDLVGWRTKAYQPAGIKKLIERNFRLRIKYWEEDLEAVESCNGVFFTAFSGGTHAETVGVHYDDPASWIMLLVYLTPNAPFDAGTSLWEHIKTGLRSKPTKQDAERLGKSVKELDDILLRDSQKPSCWREIDRVGNIYNRAVAFPSGVLHSATRHFGSNRLNGRLYQSFHFPLGKQS